MKSLLFSLLLLPIAWQCHGQAVANALSTAEPLPTTEQTSLMGCGSHHFMQHIDRQSPGYVQQADQLLQRVTQMVEHQDAAYKKADIITIPVVFHVVYKDTAENLDDSVLLNQLEILNKAFSHTHADTGNVRDEFKPVVGKADIKFELAKKDPDGNPTNGIVRTSTSIDYFGGTLPYAQSQQTEIIQWIQDTFYNNLFRLTHTNQGGSDEWDPYTYLNIWIGDLRILEPKLNNFEELLFMGLATNPKGHEFWPEVVLPESITSTGLVIHYISVGNNNPNAYPAPYGSLNTSVKQGKIVVHETGHYLGLRHIWGDVADCKTDDFIDDTPLCNNQSGFGCSRSKNSCTDNSQGADLPDMIENYMDYSSGDCQVAFTKEQVSVMRLVYKNYRRWPASVSRGDQSPQVHFYPNPNQGQITLVTGQDQPTRITLKALDGKTVYQATLVRKLHLSLDLKPGIYFMESTNSSGTQISKMVVE